MFKIYGKLENLKSHESPNGKTYYSFRVGFKSKVNRTNKNPNGYSYCEFPAVVGSYTLSEEESLNLLPVPKGEYVELTFKTSSAICKPFEISKEWYELNNITVLKEEPTTNNRISVNGTIKKHWTVENGNNPEHHFIFQGLEGKDNLYHCVYFEKDKLAEGWNLVEGDKYKLTFVPICLPIYENGGAKKVNGKEIRRNHILFIVLKYRKLFDISNEDNQPLPELKNKDEFAAEQEKLNEEDAIDLLTAGIIEDKDIANNEIKFNTEESKEEWGDLPKVPEEERIAHAIWDIEHTKKCLKENGYYKYQLEKPLNIKDKPKFEQIENNVDSNDINDLRNTIEKTRNSISNIKDIADELSGRIYEFKDHLNKVNPNDVQSKTPIEDFERIVKLADSLKNDSVRKVVLGQLRKAKLF